MAGAARICSYRSITECLGWNHRHIYQLPTSTYATSWRFLLPQSNIWRPFVETQEPDGDISLRTVRCGIMLLIDIQFPHTFVEETVFSLCILVTAIYFVCLFCLFIMAISKEGIYLFTYVNLVQVQVV